MKTTTIFSALLGTAAVATLSGCGTGQASITDSEELRASTPIPVEVTYPSREDIFATYEATATISSDADAPVIARVVGEVVELLVEEGDSVEAGQVLARLDGKRLRLEMLEAKARLVQARKEYDRNVDLHERGLISASMYEGLRYDLDALEANYDLKKLAHDYSNIRATISGVVSSREIKPGQTVRVNDVAFRITDTTELVAYLQIPQAQLPKFRAGHNASLRVASMPDVDFPASIARISPTIDTRNGTFRATAVIDNGDGALAPGMFGRFTISYEKHADALVVPAAALLDEDEQMTVYVVNGDQVERRAVNTGIESGGVVEILGGLDQNDSIVVVGHSGLRDGSKVLASTVLAGSYTG